jgi:probable rRNA maturation factor
MIEIENRSSFGIDEKKLKFFINKIYSELNIPEHFALSILYVDVKEMQELHLKWMKLNTPTDVMSFPMDDVNNSGRTKDKILGDVIICPSVSWSEATFRRENPARYFVFLHVHAILHLLGHDHQKLRPRKIMKKLEKQVMDLIEKVK